MAILRRWTPCIALLGLAGLALVGCTTSAPPPAPTVTVTVPASSPAPAPSPSPTSTSNPGGGADACLLADLTAGTTQPDGSSQPRIRVVWTNTSNRTCTMTGYAGADLLSSPRAEARYSLPRQDGPTPTVRLAPGGQAHSTVTYIPASTGIGNVFNATTILVTPPNETHSVFLDWPGGAVLDQQSATRPGTYIGPVQAGAS